jgi:hypothetical protein
MHVLPLMNRDDSSNNIFPIQWHYAELFGIPWIESASGSSYMQGVYFNLLRTDPH